jgi:hypothetical protein
MKKILIFSVFIIAMFVSFSGCKKTSEITCNLSASATQPPVEMNVVYKALQTGDGTISSLSYTTISGTVTVQNPSLPWTITVPVLTTTNVSISASGTTKNGSLTITYDGTSGGATIHGSDFCEQQTN